MKELSRQSRPDGESSLALKLTTLKANSPLSHTLGDNFPKIVLTTLAAYLSITPQFSLQNRVPIHFSELTEGDTFLPFQR